MKNLPKSCQYRITLERGVNSSKYGTSTVIPHRPLRRHEISLIPCTSSITEQSQCQFSAAESSIYRRFTIHTISILLPSVSIEMVTIERPFWNNNRSRNRQLSVVVFAGRIVLVFVIKLRFRNRKRIGFEKIHHFVQVNPSSHYKTGLIF